MNRKSVTVTIEDSAFLDLILPAVEAACIRPAGYRLPSGKQFEGVEVGGMLWGIASDLGDESMLIAVQRATVSVTAKRTSGSIAFHPEAEVLQQRLIQSTFPQLFHIGSFHSHPYISDDARDVQRDNLDGPSEADIDYQKTYDSELLSIIVTVTKHKPHSALDMAADYKRHRGKSDFSCIQFRLNDLRVWVRAIVRDQSDNDEEPTLLRGDDVTLICRSALGMFMPFEDHTDPDLSLVMPSASSR